VRLIVKWLKSNSFLVSNLTQKRRKFPFSFNGLPDL
jgi:hypothetical protein